MFLLLLNLHTNAPSNYFPNSSNDLYNLPRNYLKDKSYHSAVIGEKSTKSIYSSHRTVEHGMILIKAKKKKKCKLRTVCAFGLIKKSYKDSKISKALFKKIPSITHLLSDLTFGNPWAMQPAFSTKCQGIRTELDSTGKRKYLFFRNPLGS